MKVILTTDQIRTLKSMNQYWEEVAERDRISSELLNHEICEALLKTISPLNVLLIVGEYARTYGDEQCQSHMNV